MLKFTQEKPYIDLDGNFMATSEMRLSRGLGCTSKECKLQARTQTLSFVDLTTAFHQETESDLTYVAHFRHFRMAAKTWTLLNLTKVFLTPSLNAYIFIQLKLISKPVLRIARYGVFTEIGIYF